MILAIILLMGGAGYFVWKTQIASPQPISLPSSPPSTPTPLPTPIPTVEPIQAPEITPNIEPTPSITPIPLPAPPSPTPTPAPQPTPVPTPTPTPTPEIESPKEYIILIDGNGYQNKNPVIKTGDTVTFINKDNKLHWPGADPHPTHSSYPDFDSLGGISNNQSYSFTFTEPGLYYYHDHLFPLELGTVGIITVKSR